MKDYNSRIMIPILRNKHGPSVLPYSHLVILICPVKTTRLRQAREEAEKEAALYRTKMESEYQKKISEVFLNQTSLLIYLKHFSINIILFYVWLSFILQDACKSSLLMINVDKWKLRLHCKAT